jgi:hypothetical protein
MFTGGVEKSNQLPDLYEAVAKMGGAGFLNAGVRDFNGWCRWPASHR